MPSDSQTNTSGTTIPVIGDNSPDGSASCQSAVSGCIINTLFYERLKKDPFTGPARLCCVAALCITTVQISSLGLAGTAGKVSSEVAAGCCAAGVASCFSGYLFDHCRGKTREQSSDIQGKSGETITNIQPIADM